jgi:hypothetical protein
MIAPKILLACAFVTAFVVPIHAEDLQDNSIREAISGRRVVLSTMGFEFPLFYNASGSVTGDGTNAGLASYFTPRETGQWWVADNRLCQKFPTWYKGKTWCFQLEKVDANQLNWRRDDGFTGKARITG